VHYVTKSLLARHSLSI